MREHVQVVAVCRGARRCEDRSHLRLEILLRAAGFSRKQTKKPLFDLLQLTHVALPITL